MSHANRLAILACQINVPETNDAISRDQHLDSACSRVAKELSKKNTDLVVLPELASIDYSTRSFDKLSEQSEALNGPSFQKWRHVASEFNTSVAYSFPRQQAGQYFITVAVVDPQGNLVGHYDKIHLAQYGASMEKEYFTRGENLFVFEINGMRIAPIICYDIRIPELSRTLAIEHNVDVIIHPSAYYRDESFYSWHQFSIARALENQVYFLSLNRAGEYYGNSIFCTPWVDDENPPTLFSQHDEEFIHLSVNRESIEQTRKQYSFLQDRLDRYT